MSLQRGEVQGYDFDRMIVQFTMLNHGRVICAISTAAMDSLEGGTLEADYRVDQFMRLRDAIEERASNKLSEQNHSDGTDYFAIETISSNERDRSFEISLKLSSFSAGPSISTSSAPLQASSRIFARFETISLWREH